jgi:hypothetical protein
MTKLYDFTVRINIQSLDHFNAVNAWCNNNTQGYQERLSGMVYGAPEFEHDLWPFQVAYWFTNDSDAVAFKLTFGGAQ